MRTPSDTDFFVNVSLGRFRYGRRTFGDRLRIRSEYMRLIGDPASADKDPELAAQASIVALHKVMCVEAPDGWGDLEFIDMATTPDVVTKCYELYDAVIEKEDSFRPRSSEGSEAART